MTYKIKVELEVEIEKAQLKETFNGDFTVIELENYVKEEIESVISIGTQLHSNAKSIIIKNIRASKR